MLMFSFCHQLAIWVRHTIGGYLKTEQEGAKNQAKRVIYIA